MLNSEDSKSVHALTREQMVFLEVTNGVGVPGAVSLVFRWSCNWWVITLEPFGITPSLILPTFHFPKLDVAGRSDYCGSQGRCCQISDAHVVGRSER